VLGLVSVFRWVGVSGVLGFRIVSLGWLIVGCGGWWVAGGGRGGNRGTWVCGWNQWSGVGQKKPTTQHCEAHLGAGRFFRVLHVWLGVGGLRFEVARRCRYGVEAGGGCRVGAGLIRAV